MPGKEVKMERGKEDKQKMGRKSKIEWMEKENCISSAIDLEQNFKGYSST